METFPDLELERLRKQVKELESKVAQYEATLKEAGLLEKLYQVSNEEAICLAQIAKLKELSDKGIPFQVEDVKILEILVRTLQIARGKAPVEEKKDKKKEKPDIGKLLKIAEAKPSE